MLVVHHLNEKKLKRENKVETGMVCKASNKIKIAINIIIFTHTPSFISGLAYF